MIPYIFTAPLGLFLGTLYPAYASYKAVRTKNVREYVKWMMYWIVFAAFSAIETFTDIFVAFWFPFYYEVKILLLIWLISPVSRGSLGSSIIYRKFVHPNLMKKEDEIDRWMQRMRIQGYDSVTYYGTRAFSYVSNLVMQTAIRAPTYMAQVLAEDERTQRTANALELVRDGVADGVEDTVDGVIIEEMDVVEDEAVAGPSSDSDNRPQRKVKNTSIYQFEFSSDDEADTTNVDSQEQEPVVQKSQEEEEEEEEEVIVPPVKKRGRPKKSNTTTTLRKSSRKRNPSKN